MDEKEILSRLKKQKFQHVVSLGFFCSVAHDLENIGLRDASGPMDWVWSRWDGVYDCITSHFEHFMEKDNMEQATIDRCIYRDRKNHIIFFHDFSKYKKFDEQYPKIFEKYNRRIKKFYENMKEPTLFIRYIWSGEYKGMSEEKQKIEQDYDEFTKFIKKYNVENEIIFLANVDVKSEKLPIFHVNPDENDAVSRKPVYNNENLFDYLSKMSFENRNKNLEVFRKKSRWNNSIIKRGLIKINQLYNKFSREYIYEKQYNHGEYKC